MYWEEFYSLHIKELTLYCKEFPAGDIIEFESIDDLRRFDSEFLINIDSDIINNITRTLDCSGDEINNINVINAGLTNVSFGFTVRNTRYVYRHPGGTAGNLINRNAECFAQIAAKKLGIDDSVIAIDPSGWKISYFVHSARNCDFENNSAHLATAFNYLHKLHSIKTPNNIKVFDNLNEAKKLLAIASSSKGNLKKEFADLIRKSEKLYKFLKSEAQRLGYGLVLCHNDIYEPNYLYDDTDKIFLIDWEYAGLNYGINDLSCILCRYDWSDEQIDRYINYYFGREPREDEKQFCMAFIPICALYWFAWGLYKGSVGDDDGFFFLPAYRNLVRFIDPALRSYGLA